MRRSQKTEILDTTEVHKLLQQCCTTVTGTYKYNGLYQSQNLALQSEVFSGYLYCAVLRSYAYMLK